MPGHIERLALNCIDTEVIVVITDIYMIHWIVTQGWRKRVSFNQKRQGSKMFEVHTDTTSQ